MPIAAVSWGSGGFTVQQAGSLSLANMAVGGKITVQGGGTLSLSNVTYVGQLYGLRIIKADGAVVHYALEAQAQAQCSQPYTTLRNSWRSTGT